MSLSTSGQISFSQINSTLRITNGNLGIGTTSPSFKLDVNGTIKGSYTGGNLSISNNLSATGISVTGGIAATGNLTNGGFDFILGNFDQVSRGNSGTSRAIVKDIGNKLVLNYGGDFTGGVELGTSSAFTVANNITVQSGDAVGKFIISNTTGSFEMGINPSTINNGASYLLDYRARDLRIGAGNAEKIRLASSGNVGINTTSPGEKLDVRGNLRVGNSTQSNYIVFSGVSGDGPGSGNHTYIGERLYAGNDFSELLLFKGNDPSVTSGPDRIRLLAPEIDFDNYTAFVSGTFDGVGTYGTTQMSITTSGSICMSTTRTSAKLNVGGGIDLDGSSFIRGYGVGPLVIDPNFVSNNYIQMYDELRLGATTILKETTATMGSTVVQNYLGITGDTNVLLRFERTGAGRNDFEIGMEGDGELFFRGGADGTGAASLTEFMRIKAGGLITGANLNLSGAMTAGTVMVNSGTNRTLTYAWLSSSAGRGTTTNGTYSYSVYATDRIAAAELNIYSDQRIKTNIIDINDSSALETIRQIQPKRYNYIDTVTKGEKPVWGFIAQQVASVLDYSVNKVNEYVPNIYNKASVTHDIDGAGSILTLESGTTNVLDITKAVDQKIQIKIYIDGNEFMKEVYVKEIINTTQIKIEENLDISINQVFVYGQKVNDFHALNKDAIFTVSVSGLQEVDRQLQKVKERFTTRQTKINTLNQQIQSIMTTINDVNL